LVAFGKTSISAYNDSIPRKQRLRWATPQTSTLGSYTKRKTLHSEQARPSVKSCFHLSQSLPAYFHPKATASYQRILLSLRGDFFLALSGMRYDDHPN